MHPEYNCQGKSSLQIESEFLQWLKQHIANTRVQVMVGKNPKVKEWIKKEVERLGLKIVEWHYDPKIIFVL
jgi:hypothetical protein